MFEFKHREKMMWCNLYYQKRVSKYAEMKDSQTYDTIQHEI